MKEWLLEKTYEKPNGIVSNLTVQSSGLIHEIIHISKGIGFDYVTSFKNSEISPVKNFELSTIPSEKMDIDENPEIDDKKFYECVYIIASSHPASTFYQN